MDRETFDTLTRGVGQTCTRRSALAGLMAGVLGLGAAKRVAAQVSTEKCAQYGDACFGNTDCCSGLKCKGGDRDSGTRGSCVDKNGDRCRRDKDCGRNEVCDNGRCKKDDQCNRDNDCKLGNICKSGRCVSGCRGDSDCPKNEYCDRGRCLKDCGARGEYCSADRDCCSKDCYRNRCQ